MLQAKLRDTLRRHSKRDIIDAVMYCKRDFEVGLARPGELPLIAGFCAALHEIEGGTDEDAASTPEKALVALQQVMATGCVISARSHGVPVGSVVVEIVPQLHGIFIAVAGGLYCSRQAPRFAAIALMSEAAQWLVDNDWHTVWAAAATEKNKKRRTYAAMGFKPVREREGKMSMRSSVSEVQAALAKRRKGMLIWVQ